MSTPQDPVTLKRLAWLTALEDPKNRKRQMQRAYWRGDRLCAVALLAETLGCKPRVGTAITAADLSGDDEDAVMEWNDNDGLSFPQIAQALRKRWGL